MKDGAQLGYHPELPKFAHEAYGVRLDWIGEDGELIAHGHIAVNRFLAAVNNVLRDAGVDYDGSYAEACESISRLYAIRLPKCQDDECYRDLDHDHDADPTIWALRITKPGIPGSFPVTLWS